MAKAENSKPNTPATDSDKKGGTALILTLRSGVPVRYRAGIKITSEGVRVARDTLTKEQLAILENDPLVNISEESVTEESATEESGKE